MRRRRAGAVVARSDGGAAQAAALPLGEAAPDAEALVVRQRVLQALGTHLAARADALGLAGGAALLREERLRVRLGAQRPLLPVGLLGGLAPNASPPNISTETSGSRSRSIETGSTTCVGPIDVSASVIRFTRPPPPAPANDTPVSTSVSVRVAQASAAVRVMYSTPTVASFGQTGLVPVVIRGISPFFLLLLGATAGGAVLAAVGTGAVLVAGIVLVVLAGWAVSLCLHEFAHAFVAYRGGDCVRARTWLPDPGHPPLHERRR